MIHSDSFSQVKALSSALLSYCSSTLGRRFLGSQSSSPAARADLDVEEEEESREDAYAFMPGTSQFMLDQVHSQAVR